MALDDLIKSGKQKPSTAPSKKNQKFKQKVNEKKQNNNTNTNGNASNTSAVKGSRITKKHAKRAVPYTVSLTFGYLIIRRYVSAIHLLDEKYTSNLSSSSNPI